MTQRITHADLDRRFAGMLKAAEAVGLDVANVQMSRGSKTYGNAYRVYRLDVPPGHYGHFQFYGHDFLGMTAREAYDTLGTMAESFWSVYSASKDSERN